MGQRDSDTKVSYEADFKVNDRLLTVPDYKEEPYCIMRVIDVDEHFVRFYLSLFKAEVKLTVGQSHKWHLDGIWVTMTVKDLFFNRAKLSFDEPSGRIVLRRLFPRQSMRG